MVLLPWVGICHSNDFSGRSAVRGKLIWTLLPVALTKPMSTRPERAVDQRRASGPPPVSSARCLLSPGSPSWYQRGRHDPAVLAVEVALLRLRDRVLVPRMVLGHRVAQRVVRDERLLVLPLLVVGAAQQDPDAEIDLHEVVRDELAVDDDAGRDVHRPAPRRHVLVVEVAHLGVLERAPAIQQACAAGRPARSRGWPRT